MKKLAAMILICSMGACILAGCGEKAEPTTEQSTEAISEAISEEPTEEASDVASEAESESVPEEEPEIVNTILTFEEAQAYIEDLKTKYPDMTEEEIVALFVNFNIHSLDSETISYYSSNYDCVIIHNMLHDKFVSSFMTSSIISNGYTGIEYKDFWSLTDFITNEQLKPMAEQLETHLNTMAYTMNANEYKMLNDQLYNYMIGENDCFMYDYNDEQKTDTDLEGICYFVARYNNLCNAQEIGFNEEADISPLQRYENTFGLSK